MSMLGKGAYSFVETYEVNGVTYARKVLRLRPEAASKEYGIPSVFVREVAVLKRLSHPNIVSLIDVELDVEVKIYNIILPLARCDLLRFITEAKFDPKGILFDIAQGLLYLQEKKIYHSDVKPDNILVFPEGEGYRAAIADFGHCSIDFVEGTLPTLISTRTYRAPEVQLATANHFTTPCNVGFATMVWSFGCILYAIYEKRRAFRIEGVYSALKMTIDISNKIGVTSEELSRIVLDYPSLEAQLSQNERTLRVQDQAADLLLSKCLKFNPKERISLSDICKHTYFSSLVAPPLTLGFAQVEEEYKRDHEAVRFLRPFMAKRVILAKVSVLYDRVVADFDRSEKKEVAVACLCIVSKLHSSCEDLKEDCDDDGLKESRIAIIEERILKLVDYTL